MNDALAYDAFRMIMGGSPVHWEKAEVLRRLREWIEEQGDAHDAGPSS
jgi:hypothetical protein